MTVSADSIPVELRTLPNWVCWRWAMRDGKYTKPPVDPHTGGDGSSTNPATWTTFEHACEYRVKAKLPGVGVVVRREDRITGVDLDKCLDPETGIIERWAHEIVNALDSYTEITPSGKGLRVYVRGNLPGRRRRKGQIELYDDQRYFTVTGEHLEGTPDTIEERQAELKALCERIFGSEQSQEKGNGQAGEPLEPDDEALIKRASAAANGAKFSRLWAGEWKGDYESQSNADLALCMMLAFWTERDASRIDRLFRQSGLFREKWDSRRADSTYGAWTVAEACRRQSDTYGARQQKSSAEAEAEPEPEPEPITESGLALESRQAPYEESKPENPFTPPPHWKLLDVSEVREWNCEPLEWIVEPIIARDNLIWVSADSQSGKTLLGLYMSLELLRGGKLFDKFLITPVKKILYLGLEDPDRRFQERILDMMREGDAPIDQDRFHVYIAPGLTINDDLAWNWLEKFIETGGYALVYLDTFQKATPGISSFDDAKQSGILHRLLDLVRRLKIALIVHDHLAKNREKKPDAEMSMHDTKGSVNKQGNADCMIRLRIETVTPRQIAVRVWSKETDQETGFLLDVAAKGSIDGPKYTYAGDLAAFAKTAKAKGEKTRNEIISAMQGTSWISAGELAGKTKHNRVTIQRHLKNLIAELIVEAEGEGKQRRYRLLLLHQAEQAICSEPEHQC
jgi:DNA-binding transcriptional ArsR family regulator